MTIDTKAAQMLRAALQGACEQIQIVRQDTKGEDIDLLLDAVQDGMKYLGCQLGKPTAPVPLPAPGPAPKAQVA